METSGSWSNQRTQGVVDTVSPKTCIFLVMVKIAKGSQSSQANDMVKNSSYKATLFVNTLASFEREKWLDVQRVSGASKHISRETFTRSTNYSA